MHDNISRSTAATAEIQGENQHVNGKKFKHLFILLPCSIKKFLKGGISVHGNTKTHQNRSGLKATTVTSQAAVPCRELYFSVANNYKIIY